MRSPVNDYLTEVLATVAPDTSGSPAAYIEQLRTAPLDKLALSLVTADGQSYSSGDAGYEFSIQSISKPFVYGMVLETLGFEAVHGVVGMEPSGEAFNEVSLAEGTGRPLNPMINAGALTVHALLKEDGAGGEVSAEAVRDFFSRLAGRTLTIDADVAASELKTAYRNQAIANLVRSYDLFLDDPAEVVSGYIGQCAISVTTADLGMMAATLASGGVQPLTGERLYSPAVVRQILTVMTTCGMYDAVGNWMANVGIPAKSGVSGGIIGALPGKVGLAAFSPRLDSHGNSVRGVSICERLSADIGLHLMSAGPLAHTALRHRAEVKEGGADATVLQLQGDIEFATAETVLRELETHPVDTSVAVLDVGHVHGVDGAGRRMLLEGMRRLVGDGITVMLRDPDSILPDPDLGDGRYPLVLGELATLAGVCRRLGLLPGERIGGGQG